MGALSVQPESGTNITHKKSTDNNNLMEYFFMGVSFKK
ncbi:MAG: hypothetical protein RHS_3748 [Robinsoniella sp. RHS]|nr:MAG: hypothetical protein RHS_3748 [Robinsoniella sp. RHS]